MSREFRRCSTSPGGAFVTLHNHGELRGCILGHIEANEPIGKVVPRCAVAAGATDPRFPPITPAELDAARHQISLLGPLEPIAGPRRSKSDAMGWWWRRGWQRGLLLPQVATEWNWDAEAFLSHLPQSRPAARRLEARREGAGGSRRRCSGRAYRAGGSGRSGGSGGSGRWDESCYFVGTQALQLLVEMLDDDDVGRARSWDRRSPL